MVRYPHSITVSWQSEPVKDEDTGIYSAGDPVTYTASCAVAQNTKGRRIGAEGGKMIEYSCAVLMSKKTWKAPFEAKAVITLSDGTTFTGYVKNMLNYQTHSILWL